MNKELILMQGSVLMEILDNYHPLYSTIDKHYEYIGCDHDLWEFKAIIHRIADDKFFSVNWFDSYIGWSDFGLDEEEFELEEVIPCMVTVIRYI